MMDKILNVYLNAECVGKLSQDQAGNLTFKYDDAYFASAGRGISLSLPLQEHTHQGAHVDAFFSGLLPDESVRDRLAAFLGVSKANAFALLEIVGGDCAGAIALYPRESTPPTQTHADYQVLDDKALIEALDMIKRRPMLAGDDGYRLSLAGAQDKLAVRLLEGGDVAIMKNGAPSTHILKPMIERVIDSAHNELFCMRLAQNVGLDAPNVSLHHVGDRPYYIVERYDRTINENGHIARIHQEDFCQALGIAPTIKYQREGGPSIDQCLDVITAHTARPARDNLKFLDIVVFNFLIGNADAHGKNVSLLYTGNKPVLAPAYDLLSTAIYPDLADKMAMKIGGQYKPKDIYLLSFLKHVPDTKLAQNAMTKRIHAMSDKVLAEFPKLVDALKSENVNSDIFDDIYKVVKHRAERLRA